MSEIAGLLFIAHFYCPLVMSAFRPFELGESFGEKIKIAATVA
jgi:hypothetical protein